MSDFSVGNLNLAILVNEQGRFFVDVEQAHRGNKVVLNLKYNASVQIAFEQIDQDINSIKGYGLYLSRHVKAQYTSSHMSISVNGGAEEQVEVLEISDSDLKKIQDIANRALTPSTHTSKPASLIHQDHLVKISAMHSTGVFLAGRTKITKTSTSQSRKIQMNHAQRERHLELKSNELHRTKKRLERQRTRNIEIDNSEKRKKQESSEI